MSASTPIFTVSSLIWAHAGALATMDITAPATAVQTCRRGICLKKVLWEELLIFVSRFLIQTILFHRPTSWRGGPGPEARVSSARTWVPWSRAPCADE
jgi:hypothetical protein